ncbi:DUF4328 domain-containing protein [Streptomyces malaysiense]|uniref:DUF4328 domain-containing protein n=1 Tax=Streptomyces malaysiense TaxID=1428626 RepID=A0A1J4Q7L1_9ACTN|nr:DUF4328 domain-containing protein [Streptomyces malaysiense]OIK28119.1 hypothetical protein VT52_007645 [Streptomyces malaysiense]
MATPMPVPPQPAPPLAPPPGARPRSPAGLGLAAAVLLGLVVVTDLFACFADQTQAAVAQDLLRGGVDGDLVHRAHRADTLYNAASVAQGFALVATAAVYLCWLWRVRANAEVFEPHGHRMKRGWAIGAWFVPIGNLWLPRRVVVDVWTASVPPGSRVRTTPVNAWWTLWVLSLLVGRTAARQYDAAHGPGRLGDAARLMLFSDALDAAAAILAVVVVVHLTRMQRARILAAPVPMPAFG